jgi:hypothetical protein
MTKINDNGRDLSVATRISEWQKLSVATRPIA